MAFVNPIFYISIFRSKSLNIIWTEYYLPMQGTMWDSLITKSYAMAWVKNFWAKASTWISFVLLTIWKPLVAAADEIVLK